MIDRVRDEKIPTWKLFNSVNTPHQSERETCLHTLHVLPKRLVFLSKYTAIQLVQVLRIYKVYSFKFPIVPISVYNKNKE